MRCIIACSNAWAFYILYLLVTWNGRSRKKKQHAQLSDHLICTEGCPPTKYYDWRLGVGYIMICNTRIYSRCIRRFERNIRTHQEREKNPKKKKMYEWLVCMLHQHTPGGIGVCTLGLLIRNPFAYHRNQDFIHLHTLKELGFAWIQRETLRLYGIFKTFSWLHVLHYILW